jgi:hypothetical protein
MTDAEIMAFCGFKPTDSTEAVARYIKGLSPASRSLLDAMKQVEMWDATGGLVPLPEGVILCGPKQVRAGRRRAVARKKD